jgi:hypothetical protein
MEYWNDGVVDESSVLEIQCSGLESEDRSRMSEVKKKEEKRSGGVISLNMLAHLTGQVE